MGGLRIAGGGRVTLLWVAAARVVGAQQWPAEVSGCRDGFYQPSPADRLGCVRCTPLPHAQTVTCTSADDSQLVECQATYRRTPEGSCVFDTIRPVISHALLVVFLSMLFGGLCWSWCDAQRREARRIRRGQTRVLAAIARPLQTRTANQAVAEASNKFLAPVRELRASHHAAHDEETLSRWRDASGADRNARQQISDRQQLEEEGGPEKEVEAGDGEHTLAPLSAAAEELQQQEMEQVQQIQMQPTESRGGAVGRSVHGSMPEFSRQQSDMP
jgi:hypothetical protein